MNLLRMIKATIKKIILDIKLRNRIKQDNRIQELIDDNDPRINYKNWRD